MINKKILLTFFLFIFFVTPVFAKRDNINEWYIDDFKIKFELEDDSTMMVTEMITADCGNLSGKHGIYRILPKNAKTPETKIKYPIKLISIKDENGRDYKYLEKEGFDTITWKIGDANIEVQGENYYEIKYKVNNVIRNQAGFDEFYWNLSGNYWDMEIDNFEAEIIFPRGIDSSNADLYLYSGRVKETSNELSEYKWSGNSLKVFSLSTMKKGQGITLSASFPEGIISPYEPSIEDYFKKEYSWFILVLISFFLSLSIWRRHGKDPKIKKPIIAEYEEPGGLSPIEMSMLISEGNMANKAITASIIRMATLGLLKINEIENKVLMLSFNEYELEKVEGGDVSMLSDSEKVIYDALFTLRTKIKLSKLKKTFYKSLPTIRKTAKDFLIENAYMEKEGFLIRVIMLIIGIFTFIAGFMVISVGIAPLSISVIMSGLIITIFALIMTKKTEKGALIAHQVKGYKDYIKTAEKHRARFYEEENIFEKVLPYAIMFDMTHLWINKMKDIYGEEYFNTYVPVWYMGHSLDSFNVDSFTSAMDSISSSISSSTSSSSGSSGGGFSGGGGGGGGGGGW